MAILTMALPAAGCYTYFGCLQRHALVRRRRRRRIPLPLMIRTHRRLRRRRARRHLLCTRRRLRRDLDTPGFGLEN